MENRFSPRMEITSSVLVFHRTIGCIKGLVKNVSAYGMFVDTGQTTLPKGTVVELAGPASWKFESRMGLPKALIIHSHDGKSGLMLTANSGRLAEISGVSAATDQMQHSAQ